jgi:PII-like signaling protein
MKRIESEMIKLKVYVDESDQYKHEPLYKRILDICMQHDISGATAIRGMAGFGCRHELHTDRFLRLSHDLPIIVEVIDSVDKINELVNEIEPIITGGMITREPVSAIKIVHAETSGE